VAKDDDDDDDTSGGSNKLRNGLIIGLVLLLLLGGGAFAVWKLDLNLPFISKPTPTETAPTPTATQTTPWQDGVKTRSFSMEVGDCFSFQGLNDTNNQYAWVVPCNVPHDAEVYSTGPITQETYPETGDDWAELSSQICDTVFAAYVGVPWYQSALNPYHLYPDQETWNSDPTMRKMICIAQDPVGGLTDTVLGSKR